MAAPSPTILATASAGSGLPPRSTIERVGRIGEVLAGVDQRAVEIEDYQSAYVAHDVGVSHTVTRAHRKTCSRETSKISRAMRSTVGLLSRM